MENPHSREVVSCLPDMASVCVRGCDRGCFSFHALPLGLSQPPSQGRKPFILAAGTTFFGIPDAWGEGLPQTHLITLMHGLHQPGVNV